MRNETNPQRSGVPEYITYSKQAKLSEFFPGEARKNRPRKIRSDFSLSLRDFQGENKETYFFKQESVPRSTSDGVKRDATGLVDH